MKIKVKFLKDYLDNKAGTYGEVENEMEAKGLINSGTAEAFEAKLVAEIDTKMVAETLNKSFKEALKEMRETIVAPKAVTTPANKSIGEMLMGVKTGKSTWAEEKASVNIVTNKTVNITTATQGQNLVTIGSTDVEPQIISASPLLQRATNHRFTGNDNSLDVRVLYSLGTAPGIFGESADLSAQQSQPLWAKVNIAMHKFVYEYNETLEAQEDLVGASATVNSAISDYFSQGFEANLIRGSTYGTNSIESIIGHAQTIVCTKDSGQTAGTISAGNINKMYMTVRRPSRSAWVMGREAFAAIQGITTGTGGYPLYLSGNNLSTSPFGTLKGLPIYVVDSGTGGTGPAALGTVGDILLGDFSNVHIVSRSGLNTRYSDDVEFYKQERVYQFTYRVGIRPVFYKLATSTGGYISDFVTLETRS